MPKPAPKPSALADLPQGWEIKKLEEIADISGGGTPSSTVLEYWDGDICWATPSDITALDSYWISNTKSKITQLGLENSSAKLLPINTILMTSRATLGYCAINTVPMATNQGFLNLIPTKDFNSKFGLYKLESIRPKLISLSSGSTFLELGRQQFRKLEILLPPLLEQQRIAAILSSVDALLERSRAVVTQLEQVRRGVMQRLLTRGIPGRHTEFQDTKLGQIPRDWKVKNLLELCEKLTDGSHQGVTTDQDSEVPFLYVSCIRNGKIDWSKSSRITRDVYETISKGREPKRGLILYTAVGSYGEAALVTDVVEFSFQRHIAYVLPTTQKIVPEFLWHWFNTLEAKSQADTAAVGNAQKTVTLKELGKFKIPVPKLDEQKFISTVAASMIARLESENARITHLKCLKKALMQYLLTGKYLTQPVTTHSRGEAL